jgi:hypothetical protein
MSEASPAGFTGEWIVRVEGIKTPEHAALVEDLIQIAIERDGPVNSTVLFDQSRWKGGDF